MDATEHPFTGCRWFIRVASDGRRVNDAEPLLSSDTKVEVIPADAHREAVEPLVEAYDHLIHERRDYAIVCIEHALVALGVEPATARVPS